MTVPSRLFWYNDTPALMWFQNDSVQDIWFTVDPGNVVDGPDYIAMIELAAPGVVVQQDDIDAVALAFSLNGFEPLTAAEIIALVGPLPTYPTGLPRFPDADGGMSAPDGWTQTWGGKVVEG